MLDGLPRDAEQPGDDPDVDHVGQLLAQSVVLDLCLGELGKRHRVVGDVGPGVCRRVGLLVDHHTAGSDGLQVVSPRRGVERDQDVDLVRPGHVPLGRDSQLVPGREALDVGGEDVFGRDRDSHVEDGPGQHQVGGLTAGSVDGRRLDGEVVDDGFGHLGSEFRILRACKFTPRFLRVVKS